MKTIHRIKGILRSVFTIKILPLSLSALLITSCSASQPTGEPENSSDSTVTEVIPESTDTVSETTVITSEEITVVTEKEDDFDFNKPYIFGGDTSSDDVTELDFKYCKEAFEKDGAFILNSEHITAYDIDYDGQDEILALYSYTFFVFEKKDGEITESHRTEVTSKEFWTNLNLKTYSDGEERYPYSTFFYNNNAMTSDALVAIKYDSETDSYYFDYVISWGKIEYGEPVDVFNHAFFRKGWSYLDIAAGPYDSDISQEEFLEIYNKYEGLPPWDTYIKEYDLLTE